MSQRSNLRYQALPWLPRLVLMLLACGVVIGALGDEVFAQEVSDAQMRIFEDHVRRGGFFLHEKQFPEAIEELENARQIIDHPRVALTIAQAFEQWGQCVETRNHARALAMREDLGESARQTVVEMLATTRSCAQSGRLIVDCPEGATIEISGDDAASCPLDRELSAGAHTLRVHAQGYETRTERVDIGVLETRQIAISLDPEKSPESISDTLVNWKAYAGYGGIGVGATLITFGIISDMSTTRRLDEILSAQDPERVRVLEAQASSARTRTMVLYGAGALFVVGGGVLLYLSKSSDSEDTAERVFYVQPRPGGFSAVLETRW